MRLTIITIFIFIFSFSKGQQVTEDSLMKICQAGFDYWKEDVPDYATKSFTKIISIDSSYYKIYYLRALSYLWDSEQSYSENGVFIHDFDDSTLIKKAVYDLKKCIQLYFVQAKSFPANLTCFDEEYKITIKTEKLLDDRSFSEKNQNVIDGVLTYITSNKKNKKLACDCWEKARDQKVYLVDILINEFCK